MKLRRFFAEDSRSAIRMVRETLGADAVILSNRRVDGGVEVVAAVDYDEAAVQEVALPVANKPQRRQPEPATTPPSKARPAAATGKRTQGAANIIWSQEPTMVEMRREIQRLRGLMEHQLSGLAWGDMARERPARAQILRRLLTLGISPQLGRELLDGLQGEEAMDPLWREALQTLSAQLPIAEVDPIERGGAVALVGPTGVGKTTTLAKLAARCALRHGKSQVGLITTDNYRIGAYDQLRAYARILDVPVRSVRNAEELAAALREFADRRLTLIDTAGVGQRDARLTEQATLLAQPQIAVYPYLVMSATTQLHGLQEVVRHFARVRPVGCIITKLDECTAIGGALSVAIAQRLPIAYVSDGQNVPEDLQRARRNNLVNRAMAVTRERGCAVEEQAMAFAYGGMAVNAHY